MAIALSNLCSRERKDCNGKMKKINLLEEEILDILSFQGKCTSGEDALTKDLCMKCKMLSHFSS